MDYEEAMAREALRRVAIYRNVNEKARQIGVSEGTVRRWLRNQFPTFRGKTRPILDRFLGLDGLAVEEATAKLDKFRDLAISAVADARALALLEEEKQRAKGDG
jgi:hypothetical protein